jgi:hypothetical protein
MTEKKILTTPGSQNFQEIIERGMIYVDKTQCLADMIESEDKTCFLARPRRFGKSLTVSTLESIFSGNKELFEGLKIKEKLNEKIFAPRPVVHLDMSGVASSKNYEEFEKSLLITTHDVADEFGITISYDPSSPLLFQLLLKKLFKKNRQKIAVLIDEYDTPVTRLLEKPEEAEKARSLLRDYYSQLKVCEPYTSFVFVTGISKFVQGGLYSAFNNPTDISFYPEYGAITGFTHEEIKKNYSTQIKKTANKLDMTPKKLLEEMKNYYNGFCFDGQTLIYNPISTLLFFKSKEFENFWFNTATPNQLIALYRNNKFTLDQFSNIAIDKRKIKNPTFVDKPDPAVLLYQTGYLTLRPGSSIKEYNLDYPNTEVRNSMAIHLVERYFKSDNVIPELRKNLLEALSKRDPEALIVELNLLLANIPYDDYKTSVLNKKFKLDEAFYRSHFLTYFYALDLNPIAEKHISSGRPDIIIEYARQVWVIELKVAHTENENQSLAEKSFDQIIETKSGAPYRDPVLLGIVVFDKERAITNWKCQGGLSNGPSLKNEPPASDKSSPKPPRMN